MVGARWKETVRIASETDDMLLPANSEKDENERHGTLFMRAPFDDRK